MIINSMVCKLAAYELVFSMISVLYSFIKMLRRNVIEAPERVPITDNAVVGTSYGEAKPTQTDKTNISSTGILQKAIEIVLLSF